jgi:CheY-like chemotaxis protein
LTTRLRAYNRATMPRRVLVVDDDPGIREFVLLALSDEGYDVLAAPDGHAALACAAAHPPDVVLLDFNMPGCDGRCFLEGYRRARPEPRAPVVLVTAARDARQRAAEVGADHHLGKPFDLDALLDLVARLAA